MFSDSQLYIMSVRVCISPVLWSTHLPLFFFFGNYFNFFIADPPSTSDHPDRCLNQISPVLIFWPILDRHLRVIISQTMNAPPLLPLKMNGKKINICAWSHLPQLQRFHWNFVIFKRPIKAAKLNPHHSVWKWPSTWLPAQINRQKPQPVATAAVFGGHEMSGRWPNGN